MQAPRLRTEALAGCVVPRPVRIAAVSQDGSRARRAKVRGLLRIGHDGHRFRRVAAATPERDSGDDRARRTAQDHRGPHLRTRRGPRARRALLDSHDRRWFDPSAGRAEPAAGLLRRAGRNSDRATHGLVRYRGLPWRAGRSRRHRNRSLVGRLQVARAPERIAGVLVEPDPRARRACRRHVRVLLPPAPRPG